MTPATSGSSAAARTTDAAPSDTPQTTTGPGERSRARRTAASTSSFSFTPKVVASPPLAPWWRRSMSSAFQPAWWTKGARRTISIRERLRPWTMTTVPFAPGAGTHQPLRSTPSAERKATSSEASWNEAGVRPAFSLSGNWKRRVVAMPARK